MGKIHINNTKENLLRTWCSQQKQKLTKNNEYEYI